MKMSIGRSPSSKMRYGDIGRKKRGRKRQRIDGDREREEREREEQRQTLAVSINYYVPRHHPPTNTESSGKK